MLIVTVGILFSSKVYMVEAYQCSLQPHCGMRVSSKHKVEFYLLVDLAFLTKLIGLFPTTVSTGYEYI